MIDNKATEAKLRALLEDLKQKYPIKGIKDGHPQLIFGGWAIGRASPKRQLIFLPREFFANELYSEFALIHEYAHITRELEVKRKWWQQIRPNYHDKKYKEVETALVNSYGIHFNRMVKYPSEMNDDEHRSWNVRDGQSMSGVIHVAIICNFWGFIIAWMLANSNTGFGSFILFVTPLVAIAFGYEWGAIFCQEITYWKAERSKAI